MCEVLEIVSSETLESFICSVCGNYATVNPVRLQTDRIICGRCNNMDDGLPVPLNTEHFSNKLFHCIHRYTGCRELLRHTEILNHEDKCDRKQELICKENNCSFKGNGCQMYQHYKNDHSAMLLDHPSFTIYTFNHYFNTKKLIYKFKNWLFLIKVVMEGRSVVLEIFNYGGFLSKPIKYDVFVKTIRQPEECLLTFTNRECYYNDYLPRDKVKINLSEVKSKFINKTVACLINFKTNSDGLEFIKTGISPANNSSHRSTQTTERTFDEGTFLKMERVINNIQNNLWDLFKCINCEAYVCDEIRVCNSGHVKCEECCGDFCKLCDEVVNYSRKDQLEKLAENISLPCRWNCLDIFPVNQLRQHEASCVKRLYKCPLIICGFKGKLEQIVSHWHDANVPLERRNYCVSSNKPDINKFYLTQCNEIFYCCFEPLKERESIAGRNVHVRKTSPNSYVDKNVKLVVNLKKYQSDSPVLTRTYEKPFVGSSCNFFVPVYSVSEIRRFYEIHINIAKVEQMN